MDIQAAIYRYCNYQERCHEEVKNKLYELGADTEEVNQYLAELISNQLLNEERFAKSYCRGKFSQKKWGRNKIGIHLKQKKVSEYCIKKGLEEIDAEEYYKQLLKLTEQAYNRYKGVQKWIREAKTTQYLLGRGYEMYLIKECLKEIAP